MHLGDTEEALLLMSPFSLIKEADESIEGEGKPPESSNDWKLL